VRIMLRLALVMAGLTAMVAASAQEEVTLQHRFDLGQQMEYRITGTIGGGMQVEGGQQPMGMPVGDMQMNFETGVVAEVDAIGRDFAELAIRLQGINADMNMAGMGANFQLNEEGGGVYVGGQQVVDFAQEIAGMPGGVNPLQEIFHFPFLVRLDQSGKLKGLPQIDLVKLFLPQLKLDEMMDISTGYLPTRPVKVGDTWVQVIALPLPFPDLEGNPQGEVSYDYRLAALEQQGDSLVATINMTGHIEIGDITDLGKLLGPMFGGGGGMPGPLGPMMGPFRAAPPAAEAQPAGAEGEPPGPEAPVPAAEPGAEERIPEQPKAGVRNMVMDVDGEITFDVTRGLLLGLNVNIVMDAEIVQPVPVPPQPAPAGEGPQVEPPAEPDTAPPQMTMMTIQLNDFTETIQLDLVDVKP